jgi:deoxyadenosine/deoxycytidine kinase
MNPSNNALKIKHVAIAGNIGAGKTTLTTNLSRSFNWLPHYESADDKDVSEFSDNDDAPVDSD